MASYSSSVIDKIGIVCLSVLIFWILISLLKFLYYTFLAPLLKINAVNIQNTGKWAVVTGATDGIGKAYAEALAKRNLNIVLISRTQVKLDEVAENIRRVFNVEAKTIQVDFTNPDIYYDIDKQLHELDIGILINNVGISYPYPEYFLELKDNNKVYDNIIKCNILSVTNMCKIVLPGMLERKRGVIVNISSTAAQIPSPLLSVYSASKAFVDKFSADLQTEYNKFGITIQCLLPGYVATNMSKIRSSTWMTPSPSTYVEEAISTIGIKDRTTGYFPHALLVGVVHLMESVSPMLSRWFITRLMLNIRARALRRQVN